MLFKHRLQVIGVLLTAIGVVTTVFVAYRHYLSLRRLPRPELRPHELSLPLSLRELTLPGMRWVEVEASAVDPADIYRETVESPRTLVLKFKRGLQPDSARRRYRGILYTAVNRSPAATDPLIQKMHAANIEPGSRFAVLMVDESPWLLWRAIAKEIGVLLSLLFIVVSLTARALTQLGTGPAFRRRLPTSLNAVVISAGFASVAFAFCASVVRTHPVLPAGTILGLGLCAALTLLTRNRKSKGESPCRADA